MCPREAHGEKQCSRPELHPACGIGGAHKALPDSGYREKHPARRVGGAERALESGAPYRIEIIGARLFILAPLSGRIFAWPTPRVETPTPQGLCRGQVIRLYQTLDWARQSAATAAVPNVQTPGPFGFGAQTFLMSGADSKVWRLNLMLTRMGSRRTEK